MASSGVVEFLNLLCDPGTSHETIVLRIVHLLLRRSCSLAWHTVNLTTVSFENSLARYAVQVVATLGAWALLAMDATSPTRTHRELLVGALHSLSGLRAWSDVSMLDHLRATGWHLSSVSNQVRYADGGSRVHLLFDET